MSTYVTSSATDLIRPPLHGQIDELNGFRAIAVWMVMLSHLVYGWPLPDASLAWMPSPLLQFISHGWLGVDLFFILSGLLITGILIDSKNKPNYFKNFYGRRALRILPLYLTCILVMYLCYGGQYFLLSLFFLANFADAFGVATPHGPGVFWSLAIEEHFYLVWPLLVRYLSRNTLLLVAVVLIVGSPFLRWWSTEHHYPGVYLFSIYRFDGLALGACIALWMRSQFFTRTGALILGGVLVAVIAVVTIITIPYGVFGTASSFGVALRSTQAQFVFAAMVIVSLAYRNTTLTAPLRTSFALYSAQLSFCLYMVHLSIGDLYYWCLGRWGVNDVRLWGPIGSLAMRSVVIITASFALAAVSQKILEAPFMRLRKYFA